MKPNLLTPAIVLIALFLITNLSAQITIGSATPPRAGALLDLTEGTTTTRGLGMPCVELTKLKPTTPAELSASIGGAGTWDLDAHIGLIVYNTKDDVCLPAPGLYVWDGRQWQGIGKEEEEPATADPFEAETATTLTDREGNTYAIFTFGDAGTWMTENLRTKTAPRLVVMTESAAASTTNMYYAYPNGGDPYVSGPPASWTAQQGLLYNWHATMNKHTCNTTSQVQLAGTIPGPNEVESVEETSPGAKDGKIQGICPFGWHVPSEREWTQLEKEIENKTSLYTQTPLADGFWDVNLETSGSWRGTFLGKAMKSKTNVNLVHSNGDSKLATAGGFNFLITGFAIDGATKVFGMYGYLWSASSSSGSNAWIRGVDSGSIRSIRNHFNRTNLRAVRCKKD